MGVEDIPALLAGFLTIAFGVGLAAVVILIALSGMLVIL